MSEQKEKVGHLKPETKDKLKLCLEMASTDAQDLFTKVGRGDKVWLYKGAKEALTCIEKLKRVLNDDEQTTGNIDGRKVSPEEQAAAVLQRVAEKLEARKQRPS